MQDVTDITANLKNLDTKKISEEYVGNVKWLPQATTRSRRVVKAPERFGC